MAGKAINNLIIHCSDTPFGRIVTPSDIQFWHLFPCKNANGTFTYLGKNYKSVAALPNDKYTINGKVLSIRDYPNNGRGWSVVGYSDMIMVGGKLENLTPYDFDGIVDPWEITNGAAGVNSVSRHCVMAGGGSKLDPKRKSAIMPITEIFDDAQIETLIAYIRMQRELLPNLNIGGHNEFSSKTCPNFDVKKFLIDYKV